MSQAKHQGREPVNWPADKVQVAANSEEMYHKTAISHQKHPGVTKTDINDEAYRHPPHVRLRVLQSAAYFSS